MIPAPAINEFEFSIGGFSTGTQAVKIKNGILKYAESSGGICDDMFMPWDNQPSHNTLQKFSQSLNKLGVLNWKKEYNESNILDGTQWELKLKIGSKTVMSYGSNDYPENFEQFIATINELLGEEIVEL